MKKVSILIILCIALFVSTIGIAFAYTRFLDAKDIFPISTPRNYGDRDAIVVYEISEYGKVCAIITTESNLYQGGSVNKITSRSIDCWDK